MKNDIVLKVEQVSKKFCKTLKKSMLYGMADISRNILGLRTKSEKLRKNEFWAVDNVSFELKKGETLGIIGPNGSGKSTLLKMINGIFWPDKGKITVKGRVGALIEAGAGFHPMLTGRENIYINGAILGMNKIEIEKKFDEIIEFADIGDFIDTPVKHYSSGMFVRLGFAIAAHCEPDLLLIDEILAVGDIGFRAKCYNRISEIQKKSALIMVTHDIYNLYRIAKKTLILNKGKLKFLGNSEFAPNKYSSIFEPEHSVAISKGVYLQDSKIKAKVENGFFVIDFNSNLDISIKVKSDHDYGKVNFIFTFTSSIGGFVAEWNNWVNNKESKIKRGIQEFNFSIGPMRLNAGVYSLSFVITSSNLIEHLLILKSNWRIKIVSSKLGKAPYQINGVIN